MKISYRFSDRFKERINEENSKCLWKGIEWVTNRVIKRYGKREFTKEIIITMEQCVQDGWISNYSVEFIEMSEKEKMFIRTFLKDSYN